MGRQSETELGLAGLVHDLNNVFETIAEAAELLSEQEQSSELAATIARSVERGRRLVGGLGDRERSSVDLDVVVDRAASFLHDLSSHLRGVAVQVQSRLEPGVRLRGTPPEWERVFMNLFLNAAQAMRRGGGIQVNGRELDGRVEIEISDEGPGIPTEILARIFEPKFSTREQHSGLGLHIVDSIVRRYGGEVRAENLEGRRGARFVIDVPSLRPEG